MIALADDAFGFIGQHLMAQFNTTIDSVERT